MCDKEILSECIRTWYGSEKEFENSVKNGASAAFANGVLDCTGSTAGGTLDLVLAPLYWFILRINPSKNNG